MIDRIWSTDAPWSVEKTPAVLQKDPLLLNHDREGVLSSLLLNHDREGVLSPLTLRFGQPIAFSKVEEYQKCL
jgi:hypothetical protein